MYRVFICNTLILHLYSPQRSCGFSYGDTVKNVLRLKGTSESVACLPVSATLCSIILWQNHTRLIQPHAAVGIKQMGMTGIRQNIERLTRLGRHALMKQRGDLLLTNVEHDLRL